MELLQLVERKRPAGVVLIPGYLPCDVLHTRREYIPGMGRMVGGLTDWYSDHALRHPVHISVALLFIYATEGCSCDIWHIRHCKGLSASS